MTTLLDVAGGRTPTVSTFYRVCELLGTGRFSEVYRAFDTSTSTDVALKVYVRADEAAHSVAAAECGVLQKLSALNTEYFPRLRRTLKHRIKNKNHPVVVMELGLYGGLDGRSRTISLKQVLAAVPSSPNGENLGPIPEFWGQEDLTQWVLDSASALSLLHDAGVVHRDLKPANILIKRRAGGAQATPLILDFNSSVADTLSATASGTDRYLPPEVRAQKRLTPSPEDDLWALAMTIWELAHGLESPVAPGTEPHAACPPALRAALAPVLLKALTLEPAGRFASAGDLRDALAAALRMPGTKSSSEAPLGIDEWLAARRQVETIRYLIVDELAGEEDLPIPKDILEQVATLFSWLADEDTQSFDLLGDLVHLGPRAIPAILQEAHRLDPHSRAFEEVLVALAQLARTAPDLATKSLAFYSTSSNLGVRRMCRALCRALETFPAVLVECLVTDEGVLLPDERLELAELCIQYCSDPSAAMLALVKYLCRGYLIDQNRYHELRERVAVPLGRSSFPKKALLVVQDASTQIWEELPEFERVPQARRAATENGLLQLLADAFGSMEADALELLQDGRVPSTAVTAAGTTLRLKRVFARHLGNRYAPAKAWLQEALASNPEDPDLRYALRIKEETGAGDDVVETYRRFVHSGEKKALDHLRFSKDRRIFDLARETLRSGTEDSTRKIIQLLRGFESRSRGGVVALALDFWPTLTGADFDGALEALASYRIADAQLRDRAAQVLETGLAGPHAEAVRRALNRILETQ